MPVMLPTDSNFERTFADLAFVRLKDKAPTLLDHLVGFQLIDKNDEETHAVGVFGFKIGEEWVYAPVFFINGELKGYELLYLKNQDAFVPLTEEWVNYILNRKPNVLGEPEPRKVTQLGIRPPDFDVFARPPYIGSKYAAAKPKGVYERMRKWAHPFLDVFLVSPKDSVYSTVDKSFSLPIALKRLGEKSAEALFKTMAQDSQFAEAILRFYKESELTGFRKAAAAYTKAEAGYTEGAVMRNCKDCSNYSGGTCSLVQGDISRNASCKYWAASLGADETKEAGEKHKVEFEEQADGRKPDSVPVVIVHGDDTSNMEIDLTDSEREQLMKDRYVVRDSRSSDRKTRAYKSQLSAQLSSPVDNGLYMVLGPGGVRREVAILRNQTKVGLRRPDSAEQFVTVIDPENKTCGKYHNSDILALEKTAPLSKLSNLSNPADAIPGDKLFLLDPDKNAATSLFEIDRIDTDNEGVTTMSVSSCYVPAPSSGSSLKSSITASYPINDTLSGDESYIKSIVLTGKEGTEWRRVGSALYVPEGVKAWRLKRLPAEERKNRPSYAESPCLELATSSDILYSMSKAASDRKGVVQLQLKTDGHGYWTRVNGGNSRSMLSKLAMFKHLVQDWGLDKEAALGMIEEVKPRRSEIYWLKTAQDYTGVMSPQFNEPTQGSESWLRAPVQYPMTDLQNLSQTNLQDNRAYYQSLGPIDDDTKNVAQQASNEGQKEVLDTAVISGLVKLMDTDTRVDGYIGDLLLGLDRLGRILFMYYWHNDKFSERYGQEDLAKLEDSLRNVFESLGELTLFLKQKTIDTGSTGNAEAELTSVMQ